MQKPGFHKKSNKTYLVEGGRTAHTVSRNHPWLRSQGLAQHDGRVRVVLLHGWICTGKKGSRGENKQICSVSARNSFSLESYKFHGERRQIELRREQGKKEGMEGIGGGKRNLVAAL